MSQRETKADVDNKRVNAIRKGHQYEQGKKYLNVKNM